MGTNSIIHINGGLSIWSASDVIITANNTAAVNVTYNVSGVSNIYV